MRDSNAESRASLGGIHDALAGRSILGRSVGGSRRNWKRNGVQYCQFPQPDRDPMRFATKHRLVRPVPFVPPSICCLRRGESVKGPKACWRRQKTDPAQIWIGADNSASASPPITAGSWGSLRNQPKISAAPPVVEISVGANTIPNQAYAYSRAALDRARSAIGIGLR